MIDKKAPAFQLYPNDFLGDQKVVLMSNHQLGIYFRLLCHCWTEKSLPTDLESLARLANEPFKVFQKLWPSIRECFKEKKGRLVHGRLEKERKKQRAFSKKQSEKGKKRWPEKQENETLPSEPRLNPGLTRAGNALHITSSSSPSGDNHECIHTGSTPKIELNAQQREVWGRLVSTPPLDRVVDPEAFAVRICAAWPASQVLEALQEMIAYCAKHPDWEKSRDNWNGAIVNWLVKKTGADKKSTDVRDLLAGVFKKT